MIPGEVDPALFGIPVIVSSALPLEPSFNEDIRRQVRHGMADILEWCGIEVGPKPGALTHVLIINGRLHCSAAIVGEFR